MAGRPAKSTTCASTAGRRSTLRYGVRAPCIPPLLFPAQLLRTSFKESYSTPARQPLVDGPQALAAHLDLGLDGRDRRFRRAPRGRGQVLAGVRLDLADRRGLVRVRSQKREVDAARRRIDAFVDSVHVRHCEFK